MMMLVAGRAPTPCHRAKPVLAVLFSVWEGRFGRHYVRIGGIVVTLTSAASALLRF
jgi:hypothetical protein